MQQLVCLHIGSIYNATLRQGLDVTDEHLFSTGAGEKRAALDAGMELHASVRPFHHLRRISLNNLALTARMEPLAPKLGGVPARNLTISLFLLRFNSPENTLPQANTLGENPR
jgi:hypothetical protein